MPGGAWSSGASFVSRRVRRVIGGDGVDRAVGQAGLDRGDVGGGAQRRVDLEHGVVAGEQLVGEREVVRRRLGRDRQAVGLGGADQLDAARGREVQEVHRVHR